MKLYLAENYSGITRAGQRTFGVKIEGTTELDSVDVFAEAGGRDRALTKTVYDVTLTDGTLDIEFINQSQNPKVNGKEKEWFWCNSSDPSLTLDTTGIEILGAAGGAPPPPAPTVSSPLPAPGFKSIYINAGSSSAKQGSGGILWEKDVYFNTGAVYTKTSQSISGTGNSQKGTKDEFLYQSERYDDALIDPDMIYEIDVPDGALGVFL